MKSYHITSQDVNHRNILHTLQRLRDDLRKMKRYAQHLQRHYLLVCAENRQLKAKLDKD